MQTLLRAGGVTECVALARIAAVGDSAFTQLIRNGQSALALHARNGIGRHAGRGLADWLTDSLRGTIEDNAERMQDGLPMLASIGATAPFIGLFGTVWGIHHALVSLATLGASGVDKLAGPVGEALVMTALGLAVAIPAVLAYNLMVRANRRHLAALSGFARDLRTHWLTGAVPSSAGFTAVSAAA